MQTKDPLNLRRLPSLFGAGFFLFASGPSLRFGAAKQRLKQTDDRESAFTAGQSALHGLFKPEGSVFAGAPGIRLWRQSRPESNLFPNPPGSLPGARNHETVRTVLIWPLTPTTLN